MRTIDLTKSNDNKYRTYAESTCLACIADLWEAIQGICVNLTKEELAEMKFHISKISAKVIESTGREEQFDLNAWLRGE
jgi:hypothetical protein